MKMNKLTPGGNLRWESSRMMLPEHASALNKHSVDKLRIEQPLLDEQEIEEVCRKLNESLENYSVISIYYYQSGFINEMKGMVTKLDPLSREITLTDYEYERHKLNFDKIVNVDLL